LAFAQKGGALFVYAYVQLHGRQHDTQHYGIQQHDTQHKGFIGEPQHNNALHYVECHNSEYRVLLLRSGIQYNNIQHNDTQQ